MDGKRSFTVVALGKHGDCKTKFRGGRYISRTAAGAAAKAFNEHCRVKKIRGVCTLQIVMKETTQGSNGKEYQYIGKRHKLKDPVIRELPNGSEYVIEYGTKIHSLKNKPKLKSCKRKGKSRGRMSKKTKGRRLSGNNVRKLRRRKSRK